MPDIIELARIKVEEIKLRNSEEETITAEFKAKEKTKALTTAERLDRIERILQIK